MHGFLLKRILWSSILKATRICRFIIYYTPWLSRDSSCSGAWHKAWSAGPPLAQTPPRPASAPPESRTQCFYLLLAEPKFFLKTTQFSKFSLDCDFFAYVETFLLRLRLSKFFLNLSFKKKLRFRPKIQNTARTPPRNHSWLCIGSLWFDSNALRCFRVRHGWCIWPGVRSLRDESTPFVGQGILVHEGRAVENCGGLRSEWVWMEFYIILYRCSPIHPNAFQCLQVREVFFHFRQKHAFGSWWKQSAPRPEHPGPRESDRREQRSSAFFTYIGKIWAQFEPKLAQISSI